MDAVVLELVDHVLEIHERFVDCHNGDVGVVSGGAKDKATDAINKIRFNNALQLTVLHDNYTGF